MWTLGLSALYTKILQNLIKHILKFKKLNFIYQSTDLKNEPFGASTQIKVHSKAESLQDRPWSEDAGVWWKFG